MITKEKQRTQILEFMQESLKKIEMREQEADDNSYDAPKHLMVLTGRRMLLENSIVFLSNEHIDQEQAENHLNRLKEKKEWLKQELERHRIRRKENHLPISLLHAQRIGQYEQSSSILSKVEEICSV
jgi:hypothetical protein